MDSPLLDSHLAICTRLQLFIACVQVFWKSLDEQARERAEAADREWLAHLAGQKCLFGADSRFIEPIYPVDVRDESVDS